ncbi:hypothetical protein PISMIDRAFT_675360 [Pisolithus microcarpus 441]|uniref:Uncharacterized protein n=1 Tax=Pisolithus microcarpus 441 TaxID=765257 RepID=A0A0C9ZXY1_9AGAM|nr:hypothetical protein PISMIDRAFT_675360 [Pisolithus microcarpus 441]
MSPISTSQSDHLPTRNPLSVHCLAHRHALSRSIPADACPNSPEWYLGYTPHGGGMTYITRF